MLNLSNMKRKVDWDEEGESDYEDPNASTVKTRKAITKNLELKMF